MSTVFSKVHASSHRIGSSTADLEQGLVDNLLCSVGRTPSTASLQDLYRALALTVRDRVLSLGVETLEAYAHRDARAVAYLSAEFLPGPHLGNHLLSLGLTDAAREAVTRLGFDFDVVLDQEEEPGLGNGGLGRLASCYMDSLASLALPAVGYGIRYEFGIFDQEIRDGWQIEVTDKWLRYGNPWEIIRPEIAYDVKFGGHTASSTGADGRTRTEWVPQTVVKGVAYDTPILGYGGRACNPLRLWSAQAVESFDIAAFNHGNYFGAVQDKVASETITKILYPNDELEQGKTLRLQQQFFFVSCSLQDMLRIHSALARPLSTFAEKWAVQLNDTHPALAVVELMRLLVDERDLAWDDAWRLTQATLAYTNHTLLPEALERWPVALFGKLLPRHLELVFEINRRFLDEVRRRFPGDDARIARMSLIDEAGERYVRMANLAVVGSHCVNGVAELHSRLLIETVLRDFAEMWPQKFCNITNGITPRGFVALSNPPLTQLITRRIGSDWLRDAKLLKKLEPLAENAEFQDQWHEVKRKAKKRLAASILEQTGIAVDPSSLFDVQVKRIHEYKRQHLNVLFILSQYLQLKRDPRAAGAPRTFIFGGKAAPGYYMAKLIIKLINATATLVNADAATNARLRVVFFPNYNVKNAQFILPAADLSEQISTAGKEASGTGNMKMSMNGALTIGTFDGANVEIREEVGAENFFLFGLDTGEVASLKARGYNPNNYYEQNASLREVLDFIASGALSGGDPATFRPLVENLRRQDPFLVLADYASYLACQERVSELWNDRKRWTKTSILNAARMGKFSSDRAIREYCVKAWAVPLPD
jgi:glycogen phosphorylase